MIDWKPVGRLLYPQAEWDYPGSEYLHLSFDDGPHPEISRWVLEQLDYYGFTATFFQIGRNVEQHLEVTKEIIEKGHRIGNHSMTHPDGWKTDTDVFVRDVQQADTLFKELGIEQNNLFRPPYGHLRPAQARRLCKSHRCVLWSALAYDWDSSLSNSAIQQHLKKYCKAGNVLVFHDSEKAFPKLKVLLPDLLREMQDRGLQSAKIDTVL